MQKQIALPVPGSVSRERFCSEAAPLVENMVGGFMKANPVARQFSKEEFTSAAWLAVLESCDKFDPAKSDAVTPFIIMKVRWGLFNELNSLMSSQQGFSMKDRKWADLIKVRRWVLSFLDRRDRPPRLSDAREEFPGLTKADFESTMMFEAERRTDALPSDDLPPEEAVDRSRNLGRVADWLELNLSERDRRIFAAKTLQGRSCESVGSEFGVTKQRVHQVVQFALERMRSEIGSTQP